MYFTRLFNKAFKVVQWSIGFSKGDIEQIIRDKDYALSFKWIPLSDINNSIADPFIFKDPEGKLNLIFEEFSVIDTSKYGKIELATIDTDFNITHKKELLDAKSHASYPFVFVENNITYIIPEISNQCKVSVYEYDFENKCLVNESIILNDKRLLDSTIFKHANKYWLFATLNANENDYSSLHIYYSDSLLGKYQPHPNNPVKNEINGSRSGGNIIKVDGELYRPSQNCSNHYGQSIAINKITRLSENEFSEEFYMNLGPDKSSKFNAGIHTINYIDDVIVVDGIKMHFRPITKMKLFFKKKFKQVNLNHIF